MKDNSLRLLHFPILTIRQQPDDAENGKPDHGRSQPPHHGDEDQRDHHGDGETSQNVLPGVEDIFNHHLSDLEGNGWRDTFVNILKMSIRNFDSLVESLSNKYFDSIHRFGIIKQLSLILFLRTIKTDSELTKRRIKS